MNKRISYRIQDEGEINLSQMLFAVMNQWKKIIICIIALAFILGGLKLLVGTIGLTDKEEVAQKITEYNNLIEYNKQAKSYSRQRMSTLNGEIIEQREYVNNSQYMMINPYAVHNVTAKYYVKTNYEIMPGMVYQNVDRTESVVNMYVTALNNEEFLSILAEDLGTELRYLRELIDVENAGDGVLDIHVIAKNDEMAKSIADYLFHGVDANKKEINSVIDEHDITQISYSTFVSVEDTINEAQQEAKEKLTELMTAYSEEQENFQALSKELIEEPTVTFFAIFKQTVKFMIIGAVVGMVLACGISAMSFIFGSKLYSKVIFDERYNIAFLGSDLSDSNKKYTKIDMKLRKLEGRLLLSEGNKGYELASAYINNDLPDGGKILVIGQASVELINRFVENIKGLTKGIEVIDGQSLLTNPVAVRECLACDAIVMVEQCAYSKYADIDKEIEIIENYNQKIIGCFIYED